MSSIDKPSLAEIEVPSADETEIQFLLRDLIDAWKLGDAKAYGARFRPDGTFTNVNGGFYIGREEFDLRHEEVFRGVFKETELSLTIRNICFVRSDVALVDIDVGVFGCVARPPGVQITSDGALRTCLLMVLTKDRGEWWIAAYHNVWRSAGASPTSGHNYRQSMGS
jgi:uncharacterized protein (TIGR02246 family)